MALHAAKARRHQGRLQCRELCVGLSPNAPRLGTRAAPRSRVAVATFHVSMLHPTWSLLHLAGSAPRSGNLRDSHLRCAGTTYAVRTGLADGAAGNTTTARCVTPPRALGFARSRAPVQTRAAASLPRRASGSKVLDSQLRPGSGYLWQRAQALVLNPLLHAGVGNVAVTGGGR
ncbi:unnamed protein product [Urochloa humidicola]